MTREASGAVALERRSDERITPKGTVIVRADTYVLRGRVANLCRHGLLTHTRTTAPERLLGAAAEIAIRLDGGDASWLQLSGSVVRIGSCSLAVRLDVVPVSFTRIIDGAFARSRQNDRAVSVLLVDGVVPRRRAMADGFRAAGCAVIKASTPLEAIVWLGGTHFEPDLVAIADSAPATISDELRRFVTTEHPHAMLITIGDATVAPLHVGHRLATADGDGELAARIRDVLSRFLPQ